MINIFSASLLSWKLLNLKKTTTRFCDLFLKKFIFFRWDLSQVFNKHGYSTPKWHKQNTVNTSFFFIIIGGWCVENVARLHTSKSQTNAKLCILCICIISFHLFLSFLRWSLARLRHSRTCNSTEHKPLKCMK